LRTAARWRRRGSPMTLLPAPPSMPTQSSRSTKSDRSPSSGPTAGVDVVTEQLEPFAGKRAALKREILGIALLLFGVFLAGALGALGLATLRAHVSVRESVGFVGAYLARPLV